jgi:hypothetical protein
MSDDIHALSGAYAVDALDDIERAQFERHLAQCSACQHEVASLREASALLAETTVLQPSGQLRDRVLAGIGTVRPLPPVVAEETEGSATDPSIRGRRRRAATLLVAAAAVVAVGTGGVVWHSVGDNGGHGATDLAHTVITAPDHETYTHDLGNGATATIYRSKKYDDAVVVTHGMPAPPAGHEYVVWYQRGAAMRPAAIMPTGADNTVLLRGHAASADGVGITVEEKGPMPSTPSTDVVAVVPFRNA